MTRYLLQTRDNYVYVWTETLAAKKAEFREISEEEALERIKNYNPKEVEEEVEEVEEVDEPKHIVPEAPPEPTKEEALSDMSDMDDEVLLIRKMRSKNDVEAYMLERYGEDVDRSKTLSELKNMALEAYESRMDGK